MEIIQKIINETIFLFFEISPYLILGFFFAGIIHILLGESYIKKHFAKSGIVSTIKAAILGIPLPICSCGVIPLAESLRKEGASKSSVMSFLVSTPSSGVDSIFATYALMGPVFAIFRPIASLFSGIIIGVATHFQEKENYSEELTSNTVKQKKSIKDIFVYGFSILPSEIAQWLLIGVVVGGVISAIIPDNFSTDYLSVPFLHYFVVLIISIPLYVCATGSIPIAASLLMKGILPGAVLVFLIAGPATNTVTLSFVYKRLGKRVAAVYLVTIIITSVILGILFDLLVGEFNFDGSLLYSLATKNLGMMQIISGLLLSLIFINSKFNIVDKLIAKDGKRMEKIRVKDINCNSCKMTLVKTLKNIDGIGNLSVLVDKKEVRFDGGADVEVVKMVIKESGFNPE